MKYGSIIWESINEGEGIRTVIFFSGCSQRCKGCQNKELQDPDFGLDFTKEVEDSIIKFVNNNKLVKGITLCGGEPFDYPNELIPFVKRFKEECPDKDIWAYSGYTIFQMTTDRNDPRIELLKLCDYLVDCPYIESERNVALKFRGSNNQNIINLKTFMETLTFYGTI